MTFFLFLQEQKTFPSPSKAKKSFTPFYRTGESKAQISLATLSKFPQAIPWNIFIPIRSNLFVVSSDFFIQIAGLVDRFFAAAWLG